MIKENKFTGGLRPKFGYDVDDNGYLIPCEKEQSIFLKEKVQFRWVNFFTSSIGNK